MEAEGGEEEEEEKTQRTNGKNIVGTDRNEFMSEIGLRWRWDGIISCR